MHHNRMWIISIGKQRASRKFITIQSEIFLQTYFSDSWFWIHVSADNCSGNICSWELSGLKPHKQYGFYVRTDIYQPNSTINRNGESDIKYFRTVEQLSQVYPLLTSFKTNTTITLMWNVVKDEEPLVKLFIIDIIHYVDDDVIRYRDYCENPHEVIEPKTNTFQNCTSEIFEMKTCSETHCRKRRSSNVLKTIQFGKDKAPNYTYTIDNLQPFTSYVFEFFACTNKDSCGPFAYHFERTSPTPNGDQLNVVFQQLQDNFQITLTPNGIVNSIIVSIIIETMTLTSNTSTSTCIPGDVMTNNSLEYNFKGLAPGNFSFRVQAVSLAGLGPMTEWYTTTIAEYSSHNTAKIVLWAFFAIGIILAASVYAYRERLFVRLLNYIRQDSDTEVLVKVAFDPNFDEDVIIDRMQINGQEIYVGNH